MLHTAFFRGRDAAHPAQPVPPTPGDVRPSAEDEESGEEGERAKVEFAVGAFGGLKEGGQYNLVVVEDEEAGYGEGRRGGRRGEERERDFILSTNTKHMI